MTKILVPIVIAFFVGFYSHRFFETPPVAEPPASDSKCADLAQAKSSLVALSQSDYLEYTKIKDLKQKYEKADELLGKVMLLFLADVGFRTTKTDPPESICRPSMATPIPSPSPLPRETSPPAPATTSLPNLSNRSTQIRILRDEARIQSALANVTIDEPKLKMAQGTELNRRQIRLLEGRYVGSIKFFDRKRGDLSVTWELLPDPTKNGLSGTFNLSIHGPGTNSDSRGTGAFQNIVSLPEDKEGFLVDACGGSCYLQLYYNRPADRFYGNYYEVSEGTKKSTRVGTVELQK